MVRGKLPDLNPDDPELGHLPGAECNVVDGDGGAGRVSPGYLSLLHRASSGADGTSGCTTFIRRSTTSAKWRIPIRPSQSFFEGGRKQLDGIDSGLATVFDFPLRERCATSSSGALVEKIVDVLRHDELYPHPEMLVTFIGNHDHRRFMGEEGSNPAKLKAAFSLLLTLRGIPQIYSGDEIAMPGGDDPDNRRDFPGGFPGDPQTAFTVAGRSAEQQDVFAHLQSLLALRNSHPALRTGKQWHIGWGDNYYAFLRELPEEKLLVIYNNAAETRELNIPVEDTPLETAHQLQPIFGKIPAELVARQIHISLPPKTLAVFNVR